MNNKQFAVFSFIMFLVGIDITATIGTFQVLAGEMFLGWSSIAVAVFLAFLEIRLTQWYVNNA